MPESAARGMSGVALNTPGMIKAPIAATGIHFKKASTLLGISVRVNNKNGINLGPYVTAAIPRIRGIRLFTGFFPKGIGDKKRSCKSNDQNADNNGPAIGKEIKLDEKGI